MAIDRVKVVNAGGPGGAAATNFYFLLATAGDLTALANFFTALQPYIPSTITMQLPNTGDTVDETTGQLAGSWSTGSASNKAGSGSNIQSTPSGFEVAWLTNTVVNGHRPVGKTLIVPAASGAYATNGTITSAAATAITTAANAFVGASANFIIWHRPVYDRTHKPPTLTRPGSAVRPVSGICRTPPTVLRSRRS